MPNDTNPPAAATAGAAVTQPRMEPAIAKRNAARKARLRKKFADAAKRRERNKRPARKTDIEEFFDSSDLPLEVHGRLFITIGLVTAVCTLMDFVGRAWILFWRLKGGETKLEDGLLGYLDFTTLGLVAVCAALIAIYFVDGANARRLGAVKSLAVPDFLEELFEKIKKYQRHYTENKHVDLTFERIETSTSGFKVVLCTLVVSQKVTLERDTLKFVLQRLDNGTPGKDARVYIPLQQDGTPDEIFTIDETDIRREFPDKIESFYSELEIYIDNKPYRVGPDTAFLPLEAETDRGQRFWWIDVSDVVKGKPVFIRYEIQFPLELPGFYTFYANNPTKGFTAVLDYTRVSGDVNVYQSEFLRMGAHIHDARRPSGTEYKATCSYNGWVLPKNGVVFAWYQKRPSNGAMNAEAAPAMDGATVDTISDAGPAAG